MTNAARRINVSFPHNNKCDSVLGWRPDSRTYRAPYCMYLSLLAVNERLHGGIQQNTELLLLFRYQPLRHFKQEIQGFCLNLFVRKCDAACCAFGDF